MASYKDYKSVSAARKAGSMYFVGKDGKKKLAVTKEQLDSWSKKNKGKYKGSALTAWANAKGKNIDGAPKSSVRPKARPKSDVSGFKPEPVEVKSLVKGGRGDGRKETIKRRIKAISEKNKTTDKASNNSSAARKRGQVPTLKGAAWMKNNTFADYMALSKSEARALGLPATRVAASQHALRNQKFKDGRGFFKDSAPKSSSGGRNNPRNPGNVINSKPGASSGGRNNPRN